MTYISKNITYQEAIRSGIAARYGIKNIPSAAQLSNMQVVANKVFEPLRAWACEKRGKNTPLIITSFYRNQQVNRILTKSSTLSDHTRGAAIDIDIDNRYSDLSNADLFYFIYNNLQFKQLIWEFGDDNNPDWVHVSYVEGENRKQVLRAWSSPTGAIYRKFVPIIKK